jgi:hypothetical protein
VHHVEVRGLTIQNSSGRGLVNGGSYNRVVGTHIRNTQQSGILTTNWSAPATHNEYLGNDVTRTVLANACSAPSDPCAATGGWESAINQYDEGASAAGGNTYAGNLVHDNNGEGATAMDGDTFTGNTFHDNFSFELYLDGVQHVTVADNLFYEAEQAYLPFTKSSSYRLLAHGVGLADELTPRNASNTIRNNLIVNTRIGIDFWRATSGSGLKSVLIESNTIVNTWDTGIDFDSGAHTNTQVRNNVVVPRTGGITSGVNGVAGISATGNIFTTRGAANDPKLPGEGTFSVDPAHYGRS